ncbi:MAG: hypothetical protein HYY16_06115 [Planctomycetes bacterium]|nr:hypothetical protein [Planctomycetota bacterium]
MANPPNRPKGPKPVNPPKPPANPTQQAQLPVPQPIQGQAPAKEGEKKA